MASTGKQGGYLGYFIAGGVVASTGGALLAVGLIFIWLGNAFPDLMGEINGVPAPVAGLFITMGIGFATGGTIPIAVGLALLGIGMSKRKKQYTATTPQATTARDTTPATQGFDAVHEVAGIERG